jgi:hypothetical protein
VTLFHPDFAEPPDTSTQVTRLPGTADAPCLCLEPECAWPFCVPEDEEEVVRRDPAQHT